MSRTRLACGSRANFAVRVRARSGGDRTVGEPAGMGQRASYIGHEVERDAGWPGGVCAMRRVGDVGVVIGKPP